MRIFLKLFIGFWLLQIVLVGLGAWMAFQLRGEVEAAFHEEMERLAEVRMELGSVLEERGTDAFRQTLVSHADKEWLYLLDRQGNDLLQRELPSFLKRKIARKQERRALRQQQRELNGDSQRWQHEKGEPPPHRGFRRPPRDPDRMVPPPSPMRLISLEGERFNLEIRPKRPRLWKIVISRPWIIGGLITTSLITVFLLALHFTRPIQQLQRSARRLAKGDMQARCKPSRYRLPDELSSLSHDFNRMAERLQSLFSAQKQLISDVSHELRSPMARMRVALELADRNPGEQAKNLAIVQREIDRLEKLIHQILTLSRPASMGDQPLEGVVDLQALLETIVEDVNLEGTASGRQVLFEAGDEQLVRANPVPLHSAIENVVRNALRHTPEGDQVVVELTQQQRELTLSVRDRGPGVPESALTQIFEPFFRVSEARDRQSGGYGLGLAIASRVIREHGGTIAATNHPDGGLEVVMTLPWDSALHEQG
uniref:histidine kinase n=1 Tax=Magnetococcus massalia (strain MO-1) TaxID=451514 RepID=A0A1S7LEA2_MAGMO|nr:protein of unknown function, putative sensor protein with HAMP linker domain [Candidatus Magnetococcus massalia]